MFDGSVILCLNIFKSLLQIFPYFTLAFKILSKHDFLATTGELGYDGPLYDGLLHMTDDMLGPSSMHIKYSSYVYDGFCI